MFLGHPNTHSIVMIAKSGRLSEEEPRNSFLSTRPSGAAKAMLEYIAGVTAPSGARAGAHAGAIISGGKATPLEDRSMEAAGLGPPVSRAASERPLSKN